MGNENNDNFIEKAKRAIKKFAVKARDYILAAKVELIVLAAAIILDLVSKAIVGATMGVGEAVTVIPKFLNFRYVRNDAAAFGSSFGLDKVLGPMGVRVIFIIISIAAIGLFGYLMYKSRGKKTMIRLAYALIIGGAFGNLVDRVAFGYVRDFVEIVYFGLTIFGSTSFAIFNIADAALVVGVILFAVYFIFIYKEPAKKGGAKKSGAKDSSAPDGEEDDDLPPGNNDNTGLSADYENDESAVADENDEPREEDNEKDD